MGQWLSAFAAEITGILCLSLVCPWGDFKRWVLFLVWDS